MEQSKFFKFIWTANGIIIFTLGIILLSVLIYEKSKELFGKKHEYNRGVIVGDQKSRAKELDLDLQHLVYDTPKKVPFSKYFYTSVYVVDKEIPEDVYSKIARANDISINLLGGTINIIFFSGDNDEAYPLLPEFGYISYLNMPPTYYYNKDESKQIKRDYIIYQIALKDTDGNGRINQDDSSAYYISDLTGKNLRQITPLSQNINLLEFRTSDTDKIYFEEVIENNNKDELGILLKTRYMYSYNLKTNQFQKLDNLQEVFDTLQERYRAQ